MKSVKFLRAYFFILIGFALATGINYFDMRQFEEQIPGVASPGWIPTDGSGIYQSLKANDEFSKKYFSPEISAALIRDYSTMGESIKWQFQNIHDSVAKKKSLALKSMALFLFL